MEDAQIIALLMRRDENALRALREQYGAACRQIALRMLDSAEDADEIVNDMLMETWEAIPPAQPDNLCAFVIALTKRLSANRWHHDHAAKRGGLDEAAALDELAGCIPSGHDVQQDVELHALTEALDRFLDTLPPEPRAIMVQRYVNLHSVREIADAYAISESKVKVTLMRTRKKLRVFLQKEEWL